MTNKIEHCFWDSGTQILRDSDGRKIGKLTKGSIFDDRSTQSTRESLITIIQAFGLNKEGENVFELESFK